MKAITAVVLASAMAVASAPGLAAENPAQAGKTTGDSMSAMMHGTPRERPQLSLALRHAGELGLSAEQEKALQQFVDRFGKEAAQHMSGIETAERELAALLQQEPADLAPADDKVRAIEKLRGDLRLQRIRAIAEGRAVRAPEQRAKLDRLAAGQSRPERGNTARGMEEMHRFMSSGRMPQAMSAMMAMAERMGGGDVMLGMVRMMEMMSMMGGGMMGGEKE